MAERVEPMVYQFKVTLKGSKPPIWRRIQVPEDHNFRDLHGAIQATMEWCGGHLHQFHIKNPRTGENEVISGGSGAGGGDFFGTKDLSEHECLIKDYFPSPKSKAVYEYDFGDGWEHAILLEKILPRDSDVHYPRCIAGKNAGPPEDCGGISGYSDLKEIIANPSHPEHKETIEWLEEMGWLGGDFNPTKFDKKGPIYPMPF